MPCHLGAVRSYRSVVLIIWTAAVSMAAVTFTDGPSSGRVTQVPGLWSSREPARVGALAEEEVGVDVDVGVDVAVAMTP